MNALNLHHSFFMSVRKENDTLQNPQKGDKHEIPSIWEKKGQEHNKDSHKKYELPRTLTNPKQDVEE